jgi:ATP-dependent protease ClpP protease subunit
MERDKFYVPEEARAFGLIDEVIVKRPPREDVVTAATAKSGNGGDR